MKVIERLPGAAIAPPENLGPVPEQRWLKVEDLVVDEDYQRPISHRGVANIRRIAAEFSWLKFSPVVVSPVEGGAYAIVDGQHRTTAALMIGIAMVPCLVIQADRRQQAQAFSAINEATTKINKLSIYKAALEAGEAWAVAVDRVVGAADIKITIHSISFDKMAPRQTSAVHAIKCAVERHGQATTAAALTAICSAPRKTGSSLYSAVITAVADVLADHKEWLRDSRLAAAFAGLDLVAAHARAGGRHRADARVKTQDLLQAEIITHLDTFFSRARAVA